MKSNWLGNVKKSVSKTVGRTGLVIKKNSPEILLGLGIVGFVGTVVTACNATLKADEIIKHHKEQMKNIKDAKEISESDPENYEYDEVAYRQDIGVQCLKTSGNLLKLYAPSIALGALSLTCILESRNILNKRYLGAVAAYNGLSAIFNEYRQRVVDEEGELKDRHYRYGTTYETLTEVSKDENGKTVKKKTLTEQLDSKLINQGDDTSRFIDSSNKVVWDRNPEFTMMTLKGRLMYLNDILHTRGHIFLNEVYDALGLPHTAQGAVLGWVEGYGDADIDFGLYDPNNENCRRFVNGRDDSILLTFNHCGMILDKI